MEKPKKFEIDNTDKSVFIKVNPKIYPLEVIYSAAYMFLDRAYVVIDGDPQSEVIVQIKAKGKEDLKKIALEFENELVNYAVYVVQAARTDEIRKTIIQKALGVVESQPEEVDDEPIDDPLGIAKPWSLESAKGLKLPEDLDAEDK